MEAKSKPSSRMVLFSGLIWAVSYIVCLIVVKEFSPSKTLGFVLAFLPALAFAYFLWHFIRGIKGMDEVERAIQLEAAVIAFSLSLLMLMVLGLLDLVVTLKKEDWSYRHLVPYFFTFYTLGIFISRRKYMGDEKHD